MRKDLYTIMEAKQSVTKSPPKKSNLRLPNGEKRSLNPLHDQAYLRRLKMANYGKWYLKPEAYSNKIAQINSELSKMRELEAPANTND